MRGHPGVDRWVDEGERNADAPFGYPAMPPIEIHRDRPDPWLRALFLGLGVIGLVTVLAGPVVGMVLALLAGGAVGLARAHHGDGPLWEQLRVPGRGDGASPRLRPWPHAAKLPVALAGTELLDADGLGRDRCGVIWHRPTGLMSATALLAPCPSALREPAVAEAYAACWWALLETTCARPEVRAAAITVDVLPSGEQHPLRLTVTVDPTFLWARVRLVADAAELTVQTLAGIDVTAAGMVELRPAGPGDLARITRAAFEPRCRWTAPDAEPIPWGELTPGTEADLPRVYRHEHYGSMSWALHTPPRHHPRAEAIPALLRPGRHPRRVTLLERATPHETARSVFVEALVHTVQPRLQVCGDRQAAAFAVGLPVGWFPPHPVERRYEEFR